MLKHRIYKSVMSSILFSDVRGGGLNAYRTGPIRMALTLAVRLGWIEKGYLTHFERILWQDAKIIMANGEWKGTIAELMQYRFWRFIAEQARSKYAKLAVEHKIAKPLSTQLLYADSDELANSDLTPWERELKRAKASG
mgnify:CR=1 FL=1|tara:strand:+ start:171 stop:587 length:417 start_codon:yes stop_codon:yes gene_type:complete